MHVETGINPLLHQGLMIRPQIMLWIAVNHQNVVPPEAETAREIKCQPALAVSALWDPDRDDEGFREAN